MEIKIHGQNIFKTSWKDFLLIWIGCFIETETEFESNRIKLQPCFSAIDRSNIEVKQCMYLNCHAIITYR